MVQGSDTMEKNVGKNDKIVRYVLAVIFVGLGYSVSWVFYILAAIAAATAALGFCGLYKIFGINTCKIK